MRYVAMAVCSDWFASVTADTIHEDDAGPVKTGLVDARGTPIYRIEDRVPLGFHPKPRVRVPAGRRGC